MHETEKILAIGYSVRHIVCSGSRAGYEMYAADAFGDVDTRRSAKKYFPLNPLQLQADVRLLEGVINEMDGIIIGSGFESADFGFLTAEDRRKILGNAPEKTKEVSNKAWLASRLDDFGIAHPLTYTGREIAEGDRLPILKVSTAFWEHLEDYKNELLFFIILFRPNILNDHPILSFHFRYYPFNFFF
ncbi:MAG: hypothetical protein WBD09_01840 [Halobacteriota archaeon]